MGNGKGRTLNRLRNILQNWSTPHGAVWLPVLPPAGAFAELAVLFGVIHLVNFIAPEIDVLNLEPSPYWLPILLLSLQYGTVAGLLAAGAATLAYVMNGLPEQNIDEHHFSYLLRVWSLPILWIGVSLVLGQFRMHQIELKQRLQDGLAQRTKEAQALTSYVGDLERRCRELERLLTTRGVQGGGGVLDALAKLGSGAADLPGFLDALCRTAFPNSQITLFALQASGLEVAHSSGGPLAGTRRLPADHALYKTVAGERMPVSVLDSFGEKVLAGEGLASVPILHDESGRVLGILKLERAGSDVLSDGVLDRLSVAARLIAPMMAEPRIIVDNTAERALAGGDGIRKRRHFTWSQDDAPRDGVVDGERGGRPRVQK